MQCWSASCGSWLIVLQNVEIQNIELQNVEFQNVEIQNVELQNVKLLWKQAQQEVRQHWFIDS